MSLEDELEALASEHEDAYQTSLGQMLLDHPGKVRRQLRHYLAEQSNRGKLKHTYDNVPRLDTHIGGLVELVCEEVEFRSASRLSFKIEIEQGQTGWLVKRFKFSLRLAGRKINMIRIHLNHQRAHTMC